MPIEIRELVIKATVVQDGKTASGNHGPDNGVSATEEVVKMCVEKVLEILNERNER